MNQFEINRNDGRSHQQVVIDRICEDEPETFYPYEELHTLLGFESRDRVRQVVVSAIPRLLKEHSRTLMNIRGQGYKLAKASEHMAVAHLRRRRADRQLKMGLLTLKQVRWDEMDKQTRLAHEGQLMVMSAIYQNQQLVQRRQDAIEQSIMNLTERVENIEK